MSVAPASGATSATDLAALIALAGLPGIGPATLLAWHRDLGAGAAWAEVVAGRVAGLPRPAHAVGAALDASAVTAAARSIDPERVLAEHLAAGIAVLAHGDPAYPEVLVHDPAPPAVLFARGRTELLDAPAVAIVGTRNATHVGCRTAAALAGGLADLGISVVSGLALGVDGAAHRGVLERVGASQPGGGTPRGATGRPVGVVACGLDRAYPSRHRALHRAVVDHGVLLSEHPLGTPPAPWRFPARNRIIAALGLALVVVESRATGGSMLTVGEALARDRPILAVPGHPSSPAAAGTLDLLADGAIVLRDLDDVLVAIGRAGCGRAAGGASATADEAAGGGGGEHPMAGPILELLTGTPRSLEELVTAMGRPVVEVARVVDELERRGRVVRSGAWLEAAASGGRRG